ncbi:MAG: hypothetical protein HYW25_04670 [Candidatus Aenigmarchaeota archaeon]|nr:hypothetical protein [Candidatus Aenigmarchaeota archaeon]
MNDFGANSDSMPVDNSASSSLDRYARLRRKVDEMAVYLVEGTEEDLPPNYRREELEESGISEELYMDLVGRKVAAGAHLKAVVNTLKVSTEDLNNKYMNGEITGDDRADEIAMDMAGELHRILFDAAKSFAEIEERYVDNVLRRICGVAES